MKFCLELALENQKLEIRTQNRTEHKNQNFYRTRTEQEHEKKISQEHRTEQNKKNCVFFHPWTQDGSFELKIQ